MKPFLTPREPETAITAWARDEVLAAIDELPSSVRSLQVPALPGVLPALLARALPLEHLDLGNRAYSKGVAPDAAQLADAGFARVRELNLARNQVGNALAKHLAGSSMEALHWLELGATNVTSGGLRTLGRAPLRLRTLGLSLLPRIGKGGIEQLCKAPAFEQVEALDLYACRLEDPELAALLDGAPGLRALNVRFDRPGERFFSKLPDATLTRLKIDQAHPTFGACLPASLTELDIEGAELDDAAMRGIAELPALHTLRIGGNRWGRETFERVLTVPTLRVLAPVQPQAVGELAPWMAEAIDAADLRQLERLELHGARVDSAWLAALRERLPGLEVVSTA